MQNNQCSTWFRHLSGCLLSGLTLVALATAAHAQNGIDPGWNRVDRNDEFPVISRPVRANRYGVKVTVSIKGNSVISRSLLKDLVVQSLQAAGGNNASVTFVDIDTEEAKRTIQRQRYSGDYDPRYRDSPSRGGFVPMTHRLDVAFVIQRNIKKHRDRVRYKSRSAYISRVDENVEVQMTGKVTELQRNIVVGSVGPVFSIRQGTLDSDVRATETKDKDLIVGLFGLFRVKIPVIDKEARSEDSSTPREYVRTFETIHEAAQRLVARLPAAPDAELGSSYHSGIDDTDRSNIRFAGMDPDRTTMFLEGAVEALSEGDHVRIPLRRKSNRQTEIGEDLYAVGRVTQVDENQAWIQLVNPQTNRPRSLSSMYAVDVDRSVEVMSQKNRRQTPGASGTNSQNKKATTKNGLVDYYNQNKRPYR